jgi:hypothetical protein
MMGRRLVEVECSGDGHDAIEMRGSFNGSFHLRPGEVTDPNHADTAVRPGLLRGPLDEVVHITTFLAIKEIEGASRPTGVPTVSNDVDVTTGDEEIAGTSLNGSAPAHQGFESASDREMRQLVRDTDQARPDDAHPPAR